MLVTRDEMKTYLGITDANSDDFLDREIDIISVAVNGYCNRQFEETTYTQTFFRQDFDEITSRKDLWLFHYPVKEIERGQEVDQETTMNALEILSFPDRGKLIKLERSDARRKFWFDSLDGFTGRIEVLYDAGFTTIPSDIKAVVFEIVADRWKSDQSGTGLDFGKNVQRMGIPGVMNIDFDYTLSKNERETTYGIFLGDHVNALDIHRSERAIIGEIKESIIV